MISYVRQFHFIAYISGLMFLCVGCSEQSEHTAEMDQTQRVTPIAVDTPVPEPVSVAGNDDDIETDIVAIHADNVHTQVASFAALLGHPIDGEQHPSWNAYNNPDVVGPLGFWYFSEEYIAMTNPVLSSAQIALLIETAPSLIDLLWQGQALFDGDMTVRDIHAARALYTHIAETADDLDTRMFAVRFLAETWSSSLTADRDYMRAIPLFHEVFETLLSDENRARVSTDIDANINLHWSLYGLIGVYNQLGMEQEKERVIATYMARVPEPVNTAGGVAFGEVISRLHNPPRDAEGLRAIADAFDRVARDHYKDRESSSIVQNCRLSANALRELANKMEQQSD